MSATLVYKNASWRVAYNTHLDLENIESRYQWCHAHCQNWWVKMSPEVWLFGSRDDAMQFYLTWA